MKARFIILWLCLLATSARADHEIALGAFNRSLHSDSANALSGESLNGGWIGYGYRLPITPLPKLELWGTAILSGGAVRGEMFQTLSTKMHSLFIAAGARARYPLWRRFVWANVRVDAGTQRASVTLDDMAGHSASDSGWGAMSTAAVGIDVVPLDLRRFGLGLRFEYGHSWTSGIDLTARSEGAPEDTIELDRMATSLGELDTGGRYFSVTLTTRF